MAFPRSVRIVEVGPRDGLQNETQAVSTATRVELIERLAQAGLKCIEAGSFVSPRAIPQMAGTADVLRSIRRTPGVVYAALTPNLRGYEDARTADASEVAVFTAASEAFNQRNIGCSIAESIERFRPVLERANRDGMRVRGYISCVAGCPYEGAVEPARVSEVAARLVELGCYEISLGDTIGVGTAGQIADLLARLKRDLDVAQLAVHFHDTYGQALANIHAALQEGVAVIDSSVAGLGGCPFAEGATGNVATEDVVYLLRGLCIETGVDLDRLIDAGNYISAVLGRPNGSRAATAITRKRGRT